MTVCASVFLHWSQDDDDADSQKTLVLGKDSEATHPSETCLMSYVVWFLTFHCMFQELENQQPHKQTARNFLMKKMGRKKIMKENQDKDQNKSGQENQHKDMEFIFFQT